MFSFIREFIKHPRRIGAIAPSGKALAEKMMVPIDFQRAECIVEYGPGTGSFTREIIKRKKDDTVLLLVEQNPVFCQRMRQEYGKAPNVFVIEGSSEKVEECLEQQGKILPTISYPGCLSLPCLVSYRIPYLGPRKKRLEQGACSSPFSTA